MYRPVGRMVEWTVGRSLSLLCIDCIYWDLYKVQQGPYYLSTKQKSKFKYVRLVRSCASLGGQECIIRALDCKHASFILTVSQRVLNLYHQLGWLRRDSKASYLWAPTSSLSFDMYWISFIKAVISLKDPSQLVKNDFSCQHLSLFSVIKLLSQMFPEEFPRFFTMFASNQ